MRSSASNPERQSQWLLNIRVFASPCPAIKMQVRDTNFYGRKNYMVDAKYSSLTTSPTQGHAMKTDLAYDGTVIGVHASFQERRGLIPVFAALQ